MTKAEFIASVAEVLEVPPDSLKPTTELKNVQGWDSTAVVNLIVLLDEMGIEVDEEKLPDCQTVQDLLELASDAVA